MEKPKETLDTILFQTKQYYEGKLGNYGATPKGVDWNSAESQALRFEQLLKVCDMTKPVTLNDYGCGYGALALYLAERNFRVKYNGFDISKQMIEVALKECGDLKNCVFYSDERLLDAADYTIASGLFNVKLHTSAEGWQDYLLQTLGKISELSRKGFAFNVLTKYSDPEFVRPDLFYADPLCLFDYCKTKFSKYVSVLHDYPLYEFTIIVKKEID